MKQKRRTKRLLALALLLAFVLGLAWASQIASVSVAGPEPEVTQTPPTAGSTHMILSDGQFVYGPNVGDS